MRVQLTKRSSTKAERQFAEILKKHRIPFTHRAKVLGKEIDFLIGNIAVEIGNHPQNIVKNKVLIEGGFSILHLTNREIRENLEAVEKHLLTNWLKYGTR